MALSFLASCTIPPFASRDAQHEVFEAAAVTDTVSDTSMIDAQDAQVVPDVFIDNSPDIETSDGAMDSSVSLPETTFVDVAPDLESTDVIPTVVRSVRLRKPLSGAVFFSDRPSLRWFPRNDAPTEVQICRDRGCSMVVETLTVEGDTAQPSRALSRGTWFWRARAARTSDPPESFTPVWEFFVRGSSGSSRIPSGYFSDLTGDGIADFAAGPRANVTLSNYEIALFAGSAMPNWETPGILRPPSIIPSTFGCVLQHLSDVNGDGFTDLLVGDSTNINGVAFVYHGTPGEFPRNSSTRMDRGAQTRPANFPHFAAHVGDVNADGYGDFFVTTRSGGGVADGEGYLALGSATGIARIPEYRIHPPAPLSVYFQTEDYIGDVNGDGFDDVGVSGVTNATTQNISFGVLPGAASYVRGAETQEISPMFRPVFNGPTAANASQFSSDFVGVGDLNVDGFADVLIAANGENGNNGALFLHYGSVSGTIPTAEQRWTSTEGGQFAYRVAFLGDVNGDGYPDFAASALTAGGSGRAYVYLGAERAGGGATLGTAPAITWSPPPGFSSFGLKGLAGIGDVNGDGFDDVAVNALQSTSSGAVHGIVLVYFGASTLPATPVLMLRRDSSPSFGFFLAALTRPAAPGV